MPVDGPIPGNVFTLVAYLVIAAFTVIQYVAWRRRAAARACPPSARR